MDTFDLQMNFRVVLKNQAQESTAELLGQMGAQRVLLVTDAGIQGAGLDRAYHQALTAKGIQTAVFNEVEPNPTTANVEAGLAVAREFGPQAFLGIGGGSVLDCAKAINILLNRGGKMADYAGPQQGGAALLPLVAAPTTAGTGSEVSPFLLISDSETHAKIVCKDWQAIPKVAVLDPSLSLTLPPMSTLFAGLDALVHGFESYVAKGSQPYTQALALKSIGLVHQNLPKVMAAPSDVEARGNMLIASNLAGMAFALSYLGLSHSLANALTKMKGTPHGLAVGMMLASVIRFNAPVCGADYEHIARYVLGEACPADRQEACLALADAVERMAHSLGMPTSLSKLDFEKSQIPALVEEALRQATIQFNPRMPTAQELTTLLESCF
ncbi:MAG: iron-containing alcohol dehydrogenase [Proteobacteria bacterium]|nr:iron-containing alcohol dehydrogenase [Pseudomonadota bacterium]MBU4275839.1 iron-containing alcohol dehydrogenase [Pseudomonadota bacterium]MBU4383874.1 iron-containing alcohol dehydrogenase [Pseudomonadota bacterium]MCG2763516.1 iron-containing alcohol dehydrogenase [Desulfarculaceae bacterium]